MTAVGSAGPWTPLDATPQVLDFSWYTVPPEGATVYLFAVTDQPITPQAGFELIEQSTVAGWTCRLWRRTAGASESMLFDGATLTASHTTGYISFGWATGYTLVHLRSNQSPFEARISPSLPDVPDGIGSHLLGFGAVARVWSSTHAAESFQVSLPPPFSVGETEIIGSSYLHSVLGYTFGTYFEPQTPGEAFLGDIIPEPSATGGVDAATFTVTISSFSEPSVGTVRFNWRKTGPAAGSSAYLIATAQTLGDVFISPNLSDSGAAQEGSVTINIPFRELSDPTSPEFPGSGSLISGILIWFNFEYSNYPVGTGATMEIWDLRLELPDGGVRYFTRGTHGSSYDDWTLPGTRPGPEPDPTPYTSLFLKFTVHPGGVPDQQFGLLEYNTTTSTRTFNTFNAGSFGFSDFQFLVREIDGIPARAGNKWQVVDQRNSGIGTSSGAMAGVYRLQDGKHLVVTHVNSVGPGAIQAFIVDTIPTPMTFGPAITFGLAHSQWRIDACRFPGTNYIAVVWSAVNSSDVIQGEYYSILTWDGYMGLTASAPALLPGTSSSAGIDYCNIDCPTPTRMIYGGRVGGLTAFFDRSGTALTFVAQGPSSPSFSSSGSLGLVAIDESHSMGAETVVTMMQLSGGVVSRVGSGYDWNHFGTWSWGQMLLTKGRVFQFGWEIAYDEVYGPWGGARWELSGPGQLLIASKYGDLLVGNNGNRLFAWELPDTTFFGPGPASGGYYTYVVPDGITQLRAAIQGGHQGNFAEDILTVTPGQTIRAYVETGAASASELRVAPFGSGNVVLSGADGGYSLGMPGFCSLCPYTDPDDLTETIDSIEIGTPDWPWPRWFSYDHRDDRGYDYVLVVWNQYDLDINEYGPYLRLVRLGRSEGMPPVRINQRSDQPGRIGQQRSVQKSERILGPNTIY